MNYKTGLEDFIGKESLSKTLRNALIPTESTKIHMEEMAVLEVDFEANKKFLQENLYGDGDITSTSEAPAE